jgi:hypothetical protein
MGYHPPKERERETQVVKLFHCPVMRRHQQLSARMVRVNRKKRMLQLLLLRVLL